MSDQFSFGIRENGFIVNKLAIKIIGGSIFLGMGRIYLRCSCLIYTTQTHGTKHLLPSLL